MAIEDQIAQTLRSTLLQIAQTSGSYSKAVSESTKSATQWSDSVSSSSDKLSILTSKFSSSSRALDEFKKQIGLTGGTIQQTLAAFGGLEKKLQEFRTLSRPITDFKNSVKALEQNLGSGAIKNGERLSTAFSTLQSTLSKLDITPLDKALAINEFNSKFSDILDETKYTIGSANLGAVKLINQAVKINDVIPKQISSAQQAISDAIGKTKFQGYRELQAGMSAYAAVLDTQQQLEITNARDYYRDQKLLRRSGAITEQEFVSRIDGLNKRLLHISNSLSSNDVLQKELNKITTEQSHAAKISRDAFIAFGALNERSFATLSQAFDEVNDAAKKVYDGDWSKISTELPKAFNDAFNEVVKSNANLQGKFNTISNQTELIDFQTFTVAQSKAIDTLSRHINDFGENVKIENFSAELRDTIDNFIQLGDTVGNTTPEFTKIKDEFNKLLTGTATEIKLDPAILDQLLDQQKEFIKSASNTSSKIQLQQYTFNAQFSKQFSQMFGGIPGTLQQISEYHRMVASGDHSGANAKLVDVMASIKKHVSEIPGAIKNLVSATAGYMLKEFDALKNGIETERMDNIAGLRIAEGAAQKLLADSKDIWGDTVQGQQGMVDWLSKNQELLIDTYGSNSELRNSYGAMFRGVQVLYGLGDESAHKMIKSVQTLSKTTGLGNEEITKMIDTVAKSNEFQRSMIGLDKKARETKFQEITAMIGHLKALGMSAEGIEKFTVGLAKATGVLTPQQRQLDIGMATQYIGFITDQAKYVESLTGATIEKMTTEQIALYQKSLGKSSKARTDKAEQEAYALSPIMAEKTAADTIAALVKARDAETDPQNRELLSKTLTDIEGTIQQTWQMTGGKMNPELAGLFETARTGKEQLRMEDQSATKIAPGDVFATSTDQTANILKEREKQFDDKLSSYQKDGLKTFTEISNYFSAIKDSLPGAFVPAITSATGSLFGLAIQSGLTAFALGTLGGSSVLSKVIPGVISAAVPILALALTTAAIYEADQYGQAHKEKHGDVIDKIHAFFTGGKTANEVLTEHLKLSTEEQQAAYKRQHPEIFLKPGTIYNKETGTVYKPYNPNPNPATQPEPSEPPETKTTTTKKPEQPEPEKTTIVPPVEPKTEPSKTTIVPPVEPKPEPFKTTIVPPVEPKPEPPKTVAAQILDVTGIDIMNVSKISKIDITGSNVTVNGFKPAPIGNFIEELVKANSEFLKNQKAQNTMLFDVAKLDDKLETDVVYNNNPDNIPDDQFAKIVEVLEQLSANNQFATKTEITNQIANATSTQIADKIASHYLKSPDTEKSKSTAELVPPIYQSPTTTIETKELKSAIDQMSLKIAEKLGPLTSLSDIKSQLEQIIRKMDDQSEFFQQWWDRYDSVTPSTIFISDMFKNKNGEKDPKTGS